MDLQQPEAPSTPKACTLNPATGMIICIDPPGIFCDPPRVRVCSPSAPTLCQCQLVAPVQQCTLTITYLEPNPSAPTLVTPAPGCDGAGAELALAVILARLLGAP